MEDVSGVGSDGQVCGCEELALAKLLHLHRPRFPHEYNRALGQSSWGLSLHTGPRPCFLPGLTERTP